MKNYEQELRSLISWDMLNICQNSAEMKKYFNINDISINWMEIEQSRAYKGCIARVGGDIINNNSDMEVNVQTLNNRVSVKLGLFKGYNLIALLCVKYLKYYKLSPFSFCYINKNELVEMLENEYIGIEIIDNKIYYDIDKNLVKFAYDNHFDRLDFDLLSGNASILSFNIKELIDHYFRNIGAYNIKRDLLGIRTKYIDSESMQQYSYIDTCYCYSKGDYNYRERNHISYSEFMNNINSPIESKLSIICKLVYYYGMKLSHATLVSDYIIKNEESISIYNKSHLEKLVKDIKGIDIELHDDCEYLCKKEQYYLPTFIQTLLEDNDYEIAIINCRELKDAYNIGYMAYVYYKNFSQEINIVDTSKYYSTTEKLVQATIWRILKGD